MTKPTVESYEKRCIRLADQFVARLDNLDKSDVHLPDKLSILSARIQADLNLADYKFKFRQADHVHWFSNGPLVISIVTVLVAITLGSFSFLQLRQKDQDTQTSLVLKVLEAPPEKRQQLLTLFTESGLLKLKPGQREQIETALR